MFIGNSATTNAGAIYLTGTGSYKDNGSTFAGNKAQQGGAILVYGEATVHGSTFEANEATGDDTTKGGGAIQVSTGNLTIQGGTFSNNKSGYYGGAITGCEKATVTIFNGTIIENSIGKTGSALCFYGCSTVVLDTVTVSNNKNGTNGVIYLNAGTLTARGITATGNSANRGGVFYISGGTVVSINDSVLTGNEAKGQNGWGGAIYIGKSQILTLTNCTISNNKAILGGGIYAAEGVMYTLAGSTTITGNEAANGGSDRYYFNEKHLVCGDTTCGCGAEHTTTENWKPIVTEAELKAAVVTGGNYYLVDDIAVTGTLTLGADFSLCLSGRVLSSANGQTLFMVGVHTLTLTDCDRTEHKGYIDPETNLWVEGTYSGTEDVTEVILYGGMIKGGQASHGGAIHVQGSDGVYGTLLAYHVNFVNNVTTTQAGAIYANTANVTLYKTTFVANASATGGAIYATKTTDQPVKTIECMFIGNSATANGGAIYLTAPGSYKDNGSTFAVNKAQQGGAVMVYGVASFNGSVFSGNTAVRGGAIYATKALTVADCEFVENKATGELENPDKPGELLENQGGAIYVSGATVEITDTLFDSNMADAKGGAIYVTGTSANALKTKNCEFVDNAAMTNGGAIYLTGTASCVDNGSNFIGNIAQQGGAAMVYGEAEFVGSTFDANEATGGSSTKGGGAIQVNGGKLTVKGGAFSNNKSGYYGGAITGCEKATVTISDGTIIENSIGKTGSALCFYGCTTVELNTVTVRNNKNATNGVIYLNTGELKVIALSATGNSANKGGVFYISGGTSVSITDSVLTGNEAEGQNGWGGAIYIAKNQILTLTNCTISNNKAILGGGIYATSGVAYTIEGTTTITGNEASTNGDDEYRP